MYDPRPQLSFGEPSSLDETRQLLETQNEPIRSMDGLESDDCDPFTEDLMLNCDECLSEPPARFPRNIS